MFEPLFRAGLSFSGHFFCKIFVFDRSKSNFRGHFLVGSADQAAERPFLQPTQHLLPISRMIPEMGSSIVNSHISHQLNKTANAWPSPMMMMNFQCHLRRCVHYICAGNHFSVALGQNCLHQGKGSCISFDNDLIGFVSTFPAHLSQHNQRRSTSLGVYQLEHCVCYCLCAS